MTDAHISARLGRATLHNSAWYQNQLITFLAIGEDTEGRFALLRVHGIPRAEPPHVHTREDELILVLSGEVTVVAGEEELHAGPGESVTIPRGLAHSLSAGAGEATFLLQFSPAGFERYFHELSEPAQYLGLPPRPSPPDRDRMVTAAARYGCLFL
jgi:quercetin dioxygenase-like cupin family protein